MTNEPVTTPRASWESKWMNWLNWAALLGVIILSLRLAREENLEWLVVVVVGAGVACLTLIRWPYGAIFVLVGASVVSRFSVQLLGWNARPEHFAAAIVSLAICGWLLLSHRRLQLEKLDYWIVGYVLINYISSLFGSSLPAETLRWALLNNLAVLPYFLIRMLVRDRETLRKALRILLAVGVVEAIYGVLCFASHYLFGTTVGMEIGQYLGDVAAPYGTLYEPNFFGDYAACCAALFIALYLAGRQHRRIHLVGFLVTSLATILSFSRAALFALAVTTIWIAWKAGRRVRRPRDILAFTIVGVGLALIVAATAVGEVTKERFTNLFQQGLTEQTTITRLIIVEEALKDIPQHPLLGNGTASFNVTFDWAGYVSDWRGRETWIGNAPLRILHDTGFLGLAAVLGFCIMVYEKIRRRLREQGSQVAVLFALSAGTLVYCISFQSSDPTILAFFWLQVGFLTSAAILPGDDSQRSANGRVRPILGTPRT